MRCSIFAVVGLAASTMPAFAQPQTIYYDNFNDVSAFTFQGAAATATDGVDHQVIRLVPDTGGKSGAATLTIPVTLGPHGAFETEFKFVIHAEAGHQWSDG